MNAADSLRISPRLIAGFGIVTLGLLWTLDNLDVIESEPLTRWWPAVLILIGLVQLLNRRPGVFPGGAVVLLIVGSVLLLNRLDVVDIDLRDLIPLLIAAFGVKLIVDSLGRKRAVPSGTDPSETVHAFAMMAGVRNQNVAREFRGGDANAIMGGVELDLRTAQLAPGQEVVLDTFAMWGGIEVTVPPHWKVVSNVLPLMGSYEDNTKPNGEPGPTLIIRGTVIMGSIEVKS